MAEGLALFREPLLRFRTDYRNLYTALADACTGVSVIACTVYNGCYPPPLNESTPVAIALFNDQIYSVAHEFSCPVLELRNVCTQDSDYANPIEPSGSGGRKIAAAIVEMVWRDAEV